MTPATSASSLRLPPPDLCGCDINDSAGDNGHGSRGRIDRCPGLGGPAVCGVVVGGIPAVSEWGLVTMVLLGLTVGTLLFRQRRAAQVP